MLMDVQHGHTMARMMAGNSKFHDQSLRDQAARLLSALLFPALFILTADQRNHIDSLKKTTFGCGKTIL